MRLSSFAIGKNGMATLDIPAFRAFRRSQVDHYKTLCLTPAHFLRALPECRNHIHVLKERKSITRKCSSDRRRDQKFQS